MNSPSYFLASSHCWTFTRPWTFPDYVFHMLSVMGAGAFYYGTHRLGVFRFLPSIPMPTGFPSVFSLTSASKHAYKNLRLQAPEVKPFSGQTTDWHGWMTSTISTFTSTGYHVVLDPSFDPKASSDAHNQNSIVYAILVQAVTGGIAEWYVLQHKDPT